MRTAEECLEKAAEVEREAVLCATPHVKDDLLALADDWRRIALKAQAKTWSSD